ncbi:transporter, PerM family [Luminiphilus syltensis NOR5-1B]|uniref:Transporter, PerM family n=1 Tax=Luminiphilus syltensis NOR5-1B TaxID=565045 RepID=B8KSA1_9GAMM|nr:AI-2E family transporter [Luminiphilus syltensis]EED36358.1 transporter, PerM family [Luminiphilus syltensis NOR5-1B]
MNDETNPGEELSRHLVHALIRVGLIALVVVACARIFAPFFGIMLWAVILAVTLFPLHQKLVPKFDGRAGRASTLMVLAILLILGVPMVTLGISAVDHTTDVLSNMKSGEFEVPPVNPAVGKIPIVGENLIALWESASEDFAGTLRDHKDQVSHYASVLLNSATSMLGAVLLSMGSMIIAGVMMAYGHAGAAAMERVLHALVGDAGNNRGQQVLRLSTATVRSVAVGVIGVALIQALLLGVGFLLAGIPAAGLLTFAVFFLGILQLPALLITLPIIAYLWGVGDGSTLANSIASVYFIVAGTADGFLKPMLLGRGVDAPMPVILLGALGGMVSMGMLGLFVGAVVLAVGYQIFMAWVDFVCDGREPLTSQTPDS